jgi:exodeoxyribonuclease-3
MKIVSWNINGIRSGFEQFKKFIKQYDPDIICLQEIKIAEDDITDEIRNISGYHSYWHSAQKRGYSGVAIYSKEKPKSIFTGIGKEEFDDEGRLIGADFGDFKVVNLYFPHSSRDLKRLDFKLKFNDELIKFLDKTDGELIICGDLNVAHEEIDLARPKDNKNNAGFTAIERKWMSDFLSLGYVDAFRNLYPETQKFTWWSNRAGVRAKNIGWRIDYFVMKKPMFDQVRDVKIHTNVLGSDHCPIELDL